MPKSVLDFPQLSTSAQDDVLYIIRGTDLDRDRRITVVDLVDGIYRNAFSSIGTVSRDAATKVLARNGDFNGWLDLSATLAASEAASAAEFRPSMSRRPLVILRERDGTVYTPNGYRSHTPGYPRMADTDVGAIGPGMQKRRTTTGGSYGVQEFDEWGSWGGGGAWGWLSPLATTATSVTVDEYNQWDVGPLTERIELLVQHDGVVSGSLGAEPVYIGLRVLPGWGGDLIIPIDFTIAQVNITGAQTVETTITLRIEDADGAQPLRYGGLAVRVPLVGSTSITERALLKLTRSVSGALSYGWAKEYPANMLGAS